MRLFLSANYRELVDAAVHREKKAGRKLTYGALAAAAGMQPAYFSNVLRKRGDFSADQLYLILRELGLGDEEVDFGLLLLEHERAHVPARKAALKLRIEDIRKESLKTEKALTVPLADAGSSLEALYYLDPFHQLVHIALGIPHYARDPALLARLLDLPAPRLQAILKTLAELGLAEEAGDHGWRHKNDARHLSQSSPICRPHQAAIRQLSLARLMRGGTEPEKSVSVTFSADKKARQRVEELFLRFLKACEKEVAGADPKELFQLNFDLFGW